MRRRRAAVVVAGHSRDLDVIARHRSDPDPSVRASAVAAAHRAGSLGAEHLAEALGDPDPFVRRRACRIAATTSTALDALVGLLDDDTDAVVEEACAACGERVDLDDSGVRRLVALATDHRDALVREAAVAALGSLAGAGRTEDLGLHDLVVDAILAAGDDVAAVRRRVAVATAALDDHRVDQLLQRMLSDRDLQVRQIAEDLTGTDAETGTPVAEPVQLRLRRPTEGPDADDPAPGAPETGSSP